MFERDGKTWMWLADSGDSYHMTSVRRDFCEYRALTDRLWVKGMSARTVGMGSVRIIVKADDGEEIPAMLKNVLHVLELSRRASWSCHRLFSLTQARRQGNCAELSDPVDHLRLHAGHDGGVVFPSERAHFVGVVAGAGCFIESYRFGRHYAIAKTVVVFPSRSPWRVAIGRALGHSGGGRGIFCVGQVGLL
jgi:hypothetical protein